MKIMFCIRGIFNSGGMERVLINRVNYLKENFNNECIIITTDQNNQGPFFKLNKEIIHEDLEINYFLNQGSFFKKVIIYLKKQRQHKKRLEKVIEKYNPDIIISMGNDDKYILPYINKDIKIILEHHFEKNFLFKEPQNLFYKLKNYIFLKKEEKLLNKYDEFLVLTKEDKEQYKNNKVKVISNPLSFYPKNISQLKNNKVISVGRLEYQKGYDLLIKVWKKVVDKYPNWILDIYGEGELKEELQKKIDIYGLKNNLFLKGKEKNIYKKYLEASIYVMSSRYEGFGMVLIEAQACGLPVVSFDCPCGPKDIISDGKDGFLCKFGDIDEMAEKIIYLIEREEERKKMGKNARENSLRFSEEKIMRQWKELFEALLKKNRRN